MLSTFALDTQVIKPELCTGCGACQGLCPYWGSHEGRTICFFDCERTDGRCQSFCPRMETDLEALKNQFFPAETLTPEIGPFRGLYLTRATDPAIREHSQHGGTMTALVELALKEGFIDSAVLTKSNGGLDAEGVLATTAEDIRACSGSSFQIPPTLAVLNKALKENTYKKIGFANQINTANNALLRIKLQGFSASVIGPPNERNNCHTVIRNNIVQAMYCIMVNAVETNGK